MRRSVARVHELGLPGVALVLAGLVVGVLAGGAFVYVLHEKNYLGNPEPRTRAAFSEVPKGQAGELAGRFRPWLKFDSREQWRPLNIPHLFEERENGVGAHQFCERPPAGRGCVRIGSEAEFRQLAADASALGGSSYIDLAGSKLDDYLGSARCGDEVDDCDSSPDSAIYYHVTQSNDRFYIDYWWFLRFNNFYRLGAPVSCHTAQAREQGICDEHEGDWEGVTVVTSPTDDESTAAQQLDYVVYAAHRGVFRYPASELGLHGTRPDVYVARGSHASYPRACFKGCDQPSALAAQGLVRLPESSYDGAEDWARDGEECKANAPGSCLLPLPRTDRDPQAWTVWPGQWGAGCGDACGGNPGAASPLSPGVQSRYQTPGCSRQGAVFACDGVALGCGDWLGPLVAAVACDPEALTEGLRSPSPTRAGALALTVRRRAKAAAPGRGTKAAETTPGVVQALGRPLAPGDRVSVSGAAPGVQVLVRAQQGRELVEARFVTRHPQPGRKALVSVSEGKRGPRLRLAGRRPVERRIFKVAQPPQQPHD